MHGSEFSMVQVQILKLLQEAGFTILESNGINLVAKDELNKSKTDIRAMICRGRKGGGIGCYINFLLLISSC